MNNRFLSVLVFAFVVAAGASFLLYRLMSSRVSTTKAAPTTVKIVLAAHNLEIGKILQSADVELRDWAGTPPPGSATRKEDVVGRGVVSPIYASEPVMESRLAAKGAGGGLAATIPKGMRAVAVKVNEVVGVAGFVTPGTRVDVLISGNPPTGTPHGTVTKTLLQNIEVLSAGQDFKKDAEGKPVLVQVVNVLVTPEQAEMLSLAINQTTIQLVLRNPLDTQTAQTPGTAMAVLFSGTKMPEVTRPLARNAAPRRARIAPVVEKPVKSEPVIVEIIQGGKKVQTTFENSGGAR